MWFLYAVSSAILFGLTGFFMKISQMRRGSTPHLLLGLYAAGSLGFALNSALEGSLLAALLDWRLWAAGAVIGAGSALGNVVFIKALDYGPASLTSPLMNLNILLIIVMSMVVYGEGLSAPELAGALLLVLSAALVAIRPKEPLSIRERIWFGLVALGGVLFFFRNGGLKVTAELGLANTPILFYSYALSVVWFAAALLPWRSGTRLTADSVNGQAAPAVLTPVAAAAPAALSPTTPAAIPAPPRHAAAPVTAEATRFNAARTGLRWGLLSGAFSYAGLQLYSVALQTGPATLVAPIFSTYGLVVVAGSVLVFKERLNRLQILALLLLFIGFILVKL
ncbi:EamA family transporter [Paenibacillus athensensis]|uniref:EamA domain-containing protein n=1 Tax=Paenibacillus athensensis TaxID=1967502 RepID=A0A4Y8Q7D4_9BACL|nr:EamA family transporter [Paenibacillus athensensis]MCD1259751.1 EamA family transporter [Paenibacillus athensensis]